VRVAFHFDAAPYRDYYGPPIEELVLRAVVEKVPVARLHAWIKLGDLLVHGDGGVSRGAIEGRAGRILTEAPDAWSTVDDAAFPAQAASLNIYVLAFDGRIYQLQPAT